MSSEPTELLGLAPCGGRLDRIAAIGDPRLGPDADRLAEGVAHHFNNILQIVRGYVSFARSQTAEGSQPRRDLDEAIDAIQRGAGLSEQVLAYFRSSDDPDDEIDLNDIVLGVGRLLPAIVGGGVVVRVEAADEPLLVRGADKSLRRALLQLCSNARDAMPDGGELTVRLAATRDGQSPCAVLSVVDTGIGMETDTARRCWSPFYTTKQVNGSMGMGLAVVRATIERLGGRVTVQTSPNAGSRFELYIPVAETSAGTQIDCAEVVAAQTNCSTL